MKRMLMRGAVTVGALAGVVLAASPAQAANPAVVDCSFAAVYASYDENGGHDLQHWLNRGTNLTVAEGNGHAWHVEVEDGMFAGSDGWVEFDCVAFLA